MIDYKLVESAEKPLEVSEDAYSIYLASDIQEIQRESENSEEPTILYSYNLKRYNKNEDELPLKYIKYKKKLEFKSYRDTEEILPIEYNKYLYDYDEKARDRINAAIIALNLQGPEATIDWTTADNQSTNLTVLDLQMIIGAVAIRSNTLHIKYRNKKDEIDKAETVEEVNSIVW